MHGAFQLDELVDVSSLAKLSRLEQLTLAENPCIEQVNHILHLY